MLTSSQVLQSLLLKLSEVLRVRLVHFGAPLLGGGSWAVIMAFIPSCVCE